MAKEERIQAYMISPNQSAPTDIKYNFGLMKLGEPEALSFDRRQLYVPEKVILGNFNNKNELIWEEDMFLSYAKDLMKKYDCLIQSKELNIAGHVSISELGLRIMNGKIIKQVESEKRNKTSRNLLRLNLKKEISSDENGRGRSIK